MREPTCKSTHGFHLLSLAKLRLEFPSTGDVLDVQTDMIIGQGEGAGVQIECSRYFIFEDRHPEICGPVLANDLGALVGEGCRVSFPSGCDRCFGVGDPRVDACSERLRRGVSENELQRTGVRTSAQREDRNAKGKSLKHSLVDLQFPHPTVKLVVDFAKFVLRAEPRLHLKTEFEAVRHHHFHEGL